MADAVVAEDLTRKFGDRVALDQVNVRIRRGARSSACSAPTGRADDDDPHAMCGVLAPTGGRATVGGFDVAASPRW